MAKQRPAWFDQTSQFCRGAGIKIMAWGPEHLIVEPTSAEQVKQIASQLNQLGFKPVDDEADAHAGMLTLSRS